MQHENELWQEYNKNGARLGSIYPQKSDFNDIELFGGTATMFYRFKDGKVEFLFQHRSKFVDRNPEKWDVSAGGHINFEEDVFDAAKREVEEEIGVKIDPSRLEFSVAYVRPPKNIIYLYFYDLTNEEVEFRFDDKEVSEVKWVAFEDLVKFWSNLKTNLQDDAIFQNQLLEWTRITRKKHEHIDK